jgi:hypothetical protein
MGARFRSADIDNRNRAIACKQFGERKASVITEKTELITATVDDWKTEKSGLSDPTGGKRSLRRHGKHSNK